MARPIVMPSFGMYTTDGTLASWLKASGELIQAGEPVLEIETEKSTLEVTAPATGILHHIAIPGDRLQVESLVGYILTPGEAVPARVPESSEIPQLNPPVQTYTRQLSTNEIIATPVARRLAAQHGIDLGSLIGSGPQGAVVESDVKAAVKNSTQ